MVSAAASDVRSATDAAYPFRVHIRPSEMISESAIMRSGDRFKKGNVHAPFGATEKAGLRRDRCGVAALKNLQMHQMHLYVLPVRAAGSAHTF